MSRRDSAQALGAEQEEKSYQGFIPCSSRYIFVTFIAVTHRKLLCQTNLSTTIVPMDQFSHNENKDVIENVVTQKKKGGFWSEIIKFTLVAILIVVPFRIFIAQPFIVSGASMFPSFKDGEYLIVDQISLQFEHPKRGEVVIFRYPNDLRTFFIKRIIGLPGEKIEIRSGVVTIKNEEHPEGFIVDDSYVEEDKKKREDLSERELGENQYFVMGDNRSGSFDSREWGPVSEDLIVGRPLVRVLPISRMDVYPGENLQTN